MNSINRTPLTKAENEPILNGSNHDHEKPRCPGGAEPLPTLTSATTERMTSIVTSMPSSTFCRLAETSMPT